MRLLISFIAAGMLFTSLPAAEPRFSVQFANGMRATGAELFEWHDNKTQPRLDHQHLFDSSNYVRWIQDNSLTPAGKPAAFVEMIGGDCLPGRVKAYRTGLESNEETLPAHLLVDPDVVVERPDIKHRGEVPVDTRWLRRVVWARRDDSRYRPSMLFYRDGRQVAYRAVRWSDDSVRLLLEHETREVPFADIAELHLPSTDPWEACFEKLAKLAPDGNGLIMHLETDHGLRVTASTQRFQAATRGGADPQKWWHRVEPVWSTGSLWIPHRAIRLRCYFRPHDVPLTDIEPSRVLQTSSLSGPWNWQRDRNVQGNVLRVSDATFAWGFGVQAHNELDFPLPACARTFRTQLGLDRAAGRGGCVRAVVKTDETTDRPIYQTEHLIGSAEVLDTGILPIDSASSPRKLTLAVDPAHSGRPAGADPLEIRDTFDWLQPLLELDPEQLQQETQRRAVKAIPAWRDWTARDADAAPVLLTNVWQDRRGETQQLILATAPSRAFHALSRQVTISADKPWLLIQACRSPGKEIGPSYVQVRFDGHAVAEIEIPQVRKPSTESDATAVSLEEFVGRAGQLELVIMGDSRKSMVDWQAIAFGSKDERVQPKTVQRGSGKKPRAAELPAEIESQVARREPEDRKSCVLLGEFSETFSTGDSTAGMLLLKEYAGRQNVLSTRPATANKPSVLRAPVTLPKEKETQLLLTVAPHPKSEWKLTVNVDGVKQHESIVGKQKLQDGWTEISVDLTKFAGENVIVEVLAQASGRHPPRAYWGRLAIESN